MLAISHVDPRCSSLSHRIATMGRFCREGTTILPALANTRADPRRSLFDNRRTTRRHPTSANDLTPS
jgi:hypothetical protein